MKNLLIYFLFFIVIFFGCNNTESDEQINSIHGPIGIKLGGKSAPEIALSIIAQLVSETYKND